MVSEPVLHGDVALFAVVELDAVNAGALASTIRGLPGSITRIGFVGADGDVTDARPDAPLTARGVDVVDSVKQVTGDYVSADIDRSRLARVTLPVFVDRESLLRGLLAAETAEVHPVIAVLALGVQLRLV